MARASHYTSKRDKILVLIAVAENRGSKAPTVRELAEKCEVGVATMHSYLKRLASEGLIEWRKGKHHSLRATQQGSQELSSLGLL